MKVEVEGFIDAALLGRLSVSREEMLECVPGDDDEDHLGRGKRVYVECRRRELTKGKTVMKYHFIFGLFSKRSTFMPKKPVMKVRGRKMNVIHDSLWG